MTWKVVAIFMLLIGALNSLSYGFAAPAEEMAMGTSSPAALSGIHLPGPDTQTSLGEQALGYHAQQDAHHGACPHQHASGHQCHLGHCAFILSSDLRIVRSFAVQRLADLSLAAFGISHAPTVRPPLFG